MKKCASGKRVYDSAVLAEQALVDLQGRNDYREGTGPVGVYCCQFCGGYHLTSKGPENIFLSTQLKDGKIRLQREANKWIDKLGMK